MPKTRNSAIPLVYMMLEKSGKILMSRRRSSGCWNGKYQLPGGHIEAREVPEYAIIRETKEEVGVKVLAKDVEMVHVSYRLNHDGTEGRADYFFRAKKWKGEIKNTEPERCHGWEWIDPKKLPKNIVPQIENAIKCVRKKVFLANWG